MSSSDVDRALQNLLVEHDLLVDFPAAAKRETEAWVADLGLGDPALEDLEHLPFVTMDEVSSRDLDQALCLQPHEGGFIAWYAIADAAHFVKLPSALFAEALRRGATAYLPGRVVSMLPKALSEGVVSLNPKVRRRALVWRMHVDRQGVCVQTTLHRARIRSRAKLAYDGVQAWLDGEVEHPGIEPERVDDPEVLASLRCLPEFGHLRLAVAEEHGVVRYRRRELAVTRDGFRFVAYADDRNDVERFNEQLSLLCNVEGARLLHEARAPQGLLQPIYRVHEPPEPQLLDRLEHQLSSLCRLHQLDPDQWGWRAPSAQSLAAFLDGLPHDGDPGRVAHAVHRQAVLMNRAAAYRSAPGPHHGVGAPFYGRFSAPMREVVGVFLHQELEQMQSGIAPPNPAGFDSADAVRDAVIEAATRSRRLQRTLDREINRLALDQLFQESRDPMPATVMGVSKGRIHVQLDAPPIDAKVYFRHLQARHGPLQVDELGLAALQEDGTPWVIVGQRVQVVVLGPDGDTDRWALDLLRA